MPCLIDAGGGHIQRGGFRWSWHFQICGMRVGKEMIKYKPMSASTCNENVEVIFLCWWKTFTRDFGAHLNKNLCHLSAAVCFEQRTMQLVISNWQDGQLISGKRSRSLHVRHARSWCAIALQFFCKFNPLPCQHPTSEQLQSLMSFHRIPILSNRIEPALLFRRIKPVPTLPPGLLDPVYVIIKKNVKKTQRKCGITRVLLRSAAAALWANQVMMHVIFDEWCCAEGGRQRAERGGGGGGGGKKTNVIFYFLSASQNKTKK